MVEKRNIGEVHKENEVVERIAPGLGSSNDTSQSKQDTRPAGRSRGPSGSLADDSLGS